MSVSARALQHPVFQSTHYTEQWEGTRPIGLWNLLNWGLDHVKPGVPVRRVAPSGLTFTLTRHEDGHRVLTVAAPDTMAPHVWEEVLDTHLRAFGEPIMWLRQPASDGTVWTAFHEPAALL